MLRQTFVFVLCARMCVHACVCVCACVCVLCFAHKVLCYDRCSLVLSHVAFDVISSMKFNCVATVLLVLHWVWFPLHQE